MIWGTSFRDGGGLERGRLGRRQEGGVGDEAQGEVMAKGKKRSERGWGSVAGGGWGGCSVG